MFMFSLFLFFFFFNDTATTEIYTLSLHDALPISRAPRRCARTVDWPRRRRWPPEPSRCPWSSPTQTCPTRSARFEESWADYMNNARRSAEAAEKSANVGRERRRLLERREMSARLHRRPAADVGVRAFHPRARRVQDLA